MDKLKAIKVKQADGQYGEAIPIGADAENIDMSSGKTLQETMGNVDVDADGSVEQQLDQLNKNKVNNTDYEEDNAALELILQNKVEQEAFDSNKQEITNRMSLLSTLITALQESLNQTDDRIDNIVANNNPTEGNSELIDIRVDFLGQLADSAGEAVRNTGKASLNFKKVLTSEDDIDTIINMGTYGWVHADHPSNAPFTSGTMFVLCSTEPRLTESGNYSRVTQICCSDSQILFRYATSAGWTSDWLELLHEENLNLQGRLQELQEAIIFKELLTSENDINNYIYPGVYGWLSTNIPQNVPGEQQFGTLLVLSGNGLGRTERVVQIIFKNQEILYRIGTTSGLNYSGWATIYKENEQMEYTHFNVGMRYNVNKFLTSAVAKKNTLPKLTSYENFDENSFYQEGETVKSIIYSSVWRFGGDVFYQRNINTFYSALANPASVVYTKNYYNYKDKISGIGCYYGAVCSTYVSYGIGSPIYYTSSEVHNLMEEKEWIDESSIEVGDVMWQSGHCRLITKIIYESEKVKAIFVSEMATNGFQETKYTVNSFKNTLTKFGGTYIIGRIPGTKYLPAPEINYCEDVMFEYGNDTYLELGSSAKFYIPSGNTIYISKNNAPYQSYSLSSYPTETINNVKVYDLSSLLSSVGNYRLTTNTNNTTVCNINVYKPGIVTISSNSATLSGYENITPSYYNVIVLKAGDPIAFPGPEGYYGQNTTIKELINSDTFTFELPETSVGYYLRVYYDTKWGKCAVDSNYVML